MKLVVIESPYAAPKAEDVEKNICYARQCMLHSLQLGEAPIASHLLYTQDGILNDNLPADRELGMNAGYAWMAEADLVAFYVDRGVSRGMRIAIQTAQAYKIRIELRTINA